MTSLGEFLAWCSDAGRSRDTIDLWRKVLSRYERDVGDLLAGDPTSIRCHLAAWNDSPANTRRTYRRAFASFYRWAHEDGRIAQDPMTKVPPVSAPRGAPRPITDLEFAAVLVDTTPTMRAWLLLGADAGLRRGEIASTRPTNAMGRHLHVTGKGARQRVVPMSLRLVDALGDAPPWTVGPDRVGVLMSDHMRRRAVDATAHQLRHYAATRYYAASGNDLRATQAFLGHASSSTTEVYVAWSSDGLDTIDRMAA